MDRSPHCGQNVPALTPGQESASERATQIDDYSLSDLEVTTAAIMLGSGITAYAPVYAVLSFNTVVSAFDRLVAFAVGLAWSVFGWYETYRLWKLKLT